MSQSQLNTKNSPTVDDAEFWENLYQTKRTPWELNRPAPPLMAFMQTPYAPKPPGRILVLGCGSGYDCMPFIEAGFEVTGVDFARSAIQHTHELFSKAGVNGTRGYLLERDFFEIHEYDQYYDYIFEHCVFSGLHPSRRRTYVFTIHDLLKPTGKHIGLWWILPETAAGPPFGLAKTDLYDLFDKKFNFDLVYEPHNSIPERKGQELITVMSKK